MCTYLCTACDYCVDRCDNLSPQLSEDLPDLPLYILAEASSACDYCVDEEEEAVAKGVRGVMQVIITTIVILLIITTITITIMITMMTNRVSDLLCRSSPLTAAKSALETSLVCR